MFDECFLGFTCYSRLVSAIVNLTLRKHLPMCHSSLRDLPIVLGMER